MVRKNIRSYVLRVLDALNCFYSLRDLEKLLEVPFQNLWKYVNLLTVPEEKTAEKILRRIQELRLIEKAVDGLFEENSDDIWGVARNPGFLRLFSLVIEDFVQGMGVNTIVPMSEYAIPLASIVAMELDMEICPALQHSIKYEKEGFHVTHYVSRKTGEYCILAMPRKCLHKGVKALLLDIAVEELDRVAAIASTIRRARAEPYCLISIQSTREVYDQLKELGIQRIKVFRII
ncbi:hypothetical protein J4526_07720 [Desulfurococcaceae archaeon MEX13E-LK6-19]|nr:hypothetical protein J4526_07720 [Desulfurococcaceae archaeon MEX13E-LK6-19]